MPWVADVGLRAMAAAISWARVHSWSRATTSVTRLMRSAVSAVTRSSFPVSAMRNVSARPTFRISPTGSSADTSPYVTCESKNVASSEQMTMSASLTR